VDVRGSGEARHAASGLKRTGTAGWRGGYDARGGSDGAGAAAGEVRHEVVREVDREVGRGGRGRRGEELESERGDVPLVGGASGRGGGGEVLDARLRVCKVVIILLIWAVKSIGYVL